MIGGYSTVVQRDGRSAWSYGLVAEGEILDMLTICFVLITRKR